MNTSYMESNVVLTDDSMWRFHLQLETFVDVPSIHKRSFQILYQEGSIPSILDAEFSLRIRCPDNFEWKGLCLKRTITTQVQKYNDEQSVRFINLTESLSSLGNPLQNISFCTVIPQIKQGMEQLLLETANQIGPREPYLDRWLPLPITILVSQDDFVAYRHNRLLYNRILDKERKR